MDNTKTNEPINTNDLPINQVYHKKEVFQHKQPADTGKPMDDDTDHKKDPEQDDPIPEQQKTSKEEGLNEANGSGNAGAFEGFEDQQTGE